MLRYLLKRLFYGLISVIIIVAIVMILVYSLLDRTLVFANDGVYLKAQNNSKEVYKYSKWEEYGYLDYVTYNDYLEECVKNNTLDANLKSFVSSFGNTKEEDNKLTSLNQEWINKFKEEYEKLGYTVVRLDTVYQSGTKVATGGQKQYFAYKDKPLITRLFSYFSNLITIDNIHYAEGDIENRGISFTFFDPVYGGKVFSPAIIGNGTKHKYLLYFDNKFPFIHQNLITLNLGVSYSINQGIDITSTMFDSQGSKKLEEVIYPSGVREMSADDLHSLIYVKDSYDSGLATIKNYFVDDYTSVKTNKVGLSRTGYSFVIGIISVIITYLLGVPLGIMMARKKDKLLDKLGTIYIVFIMAVPSLAYIFMFKSIGGSIFNLPTVFNTDSGNLLMYVLPIVSLALPATANIMKWLRRYMIDQMSSDYVKFARAGGLSESEIFNKHILKNSLVPLIHGIPAAVVGSLIGAVITEAVYTVPGTGGLLTEAIKQYDNGVIVGLALFYAVLSIISVIIGDILMSLVDPRISFKEKGV